MLLDGDWIVCSSLVGVIVGNDHAMLTVDESDTCIHVSKRNLLIIAGELANRQEWGSSVQ